MLNFIASPFQGRQELLSFGRINSGTSISLAASGHDTVPFEQHTRFNEDTAFV